MFFHQHPYKPYIPEKTTKLLIGTLPPPRFSQKKLASNDVDFCYGSGKGLLWPVIDIIFSLNLIYKPTKEAIKQRKDFLIKNKIGICDIVESCHRKKIDASDLGMQDVKLRNIISYLNQHPLIDTLLFMGGNSKNGPEYFFRKHIKDNHLTLEVISNDVPRIHQFYLDNRVIRTVSLISPSGSANRAIGSTIVYKQMKLQNPNFTTIDFRVLQYKKHFK